jgi:hypothetical protein
LLKRIIAGVLFGLISVSAALGGQLTIQPTTSLSSELGNNTSAANSFAGTSNGNLGGGNISKVPVRSLLYAGATTKIYTHVVPWWGKRGHINIGYSSQDPAQVHRQVTDMVSRGLDGVVVDWYGPTSYEDTGSKLFMSEAEAQPDFNLIIELEHGAVLWNSCYSTCDVTTAVIQLTDQVAQRFFSSPAYLRQQGRPVMMEFGMEVLPAAVDWSKVQAAHPEILWIHRNPTGFSQTKSGGGFGWFDSRTTSNLPAGYDSSSYLDYFYKVAGRFPQLLTYGSVFKGFDDALASWSPAGGRHIYQSCGQTWLKSFAMLNQWYSAGHPLYAMQLNTWNDYEEGTELETGIDNCVTVSASVQHAELSWNIQGQQNTIHHYMVFISADGEHLMPLGEFAPGTQNLNLASFDLPAGKYTLYVKAIGQPLIRNQMSAGVLYTVNAMQSSASGTVNATQSSASGNETLDSGSISGGNTSSTTAASSSISRASMNLGLASTTLKLKHGGSAKTQISLAGNGVSGAVTLACANLPAGIHCSFSPDTVQLGGTAVSSMLTVSADARAVARLAPLGGRALFALFTPGLGILGVVVGSFSSRRKMMLTGALLVLGLLSLAGCGGGGMGAVQNASAASYNITITATSAANQGASPVQGSSTATLLID